MKQQEHKSFEDNEDERLMVNINPLEKRSYLRARQLAYAGTHEVLGGLNEDEEV